MKVNSCSIIYFGVFEYDLDYFLAKGGSTTYIESAYKKNNESYLTQKYYPNWLGSFFIKRRTNNRSASGGVKVTNHLQLDFSKTDLAQSLTIEIEQNAKAIQYELDAIEVFLFKQNLGVFVIKTQLKRIK